MTNTIYLGIGGNMGDRWLQLQHCRKHLMQLGILQNQSSIYKTAAWGKQNQPDFYNQVLQISTYFNAQECLQMVLDIEHTMGRIRQENWAARIIDIDILMFNNEIIHEATLQVPHPYLHHRNFVLVPLAEIAAHVIHPLLNKNIATLLMECSDELLVDKVEPLN